METPTGSGLEFRVLGPVEAVRDGTSLSLGGPRQRALLALLLVASGRPVTADHLIDELWAGEPTAGAEVSLRTYVSRLRTALGDGAVIHGSAVGYALRPGPDAVDATRFEHLIRDGESALSERRTRRGLERFREALALWRGRPFGELAGEALRVEADRLEGLRLRAVEQRIGAELQLGSGVELVDELESLVREHPYRERLWSHLMLSLYRGGRQAEALAAYQRARRLLDEDLGIEPGEELRSLEVSILRQEVTPLSPAPATHNLPAPLTSFVGRDTEVVDALRLVRQARLVTLTGVGGVGKTRLALEIARRGYDDFADGVTFVDLAPLGDPSLVTAHVSAALEVREQPGVPPMAGLVARLRDREVLLVLDNCEHVRAECADLCRAILGGAQHLRILATSREVLGVPGEVDFPVPPLTVPDALEDATAARRSEAVRLLLDRARAARPRLDDSEATVLTAARIVADLDGLPLAIELAAARAKALSLTDIAARLDDRFRFLVSWRRLTAARHRTLREAMDWSYELLAPDEQDLLARVSVFAGGFTLEAAAAVAADGDEDVALRRIERLVDASLVAPVETPVGTRYRLLETVRQYGAVQLASAGRREATLDAHRRYYTELAERTSLQGTEQARGLVVIDTEVANLRMALSDAGERGDVDDGRRLAVALWKYWHIRGQLAEGRARMVATVEHGPDVAPALYAAALHGTGILDWTVGDYEHGRAMAAELLDLARTTASVTAEHAGHSLLGMIALRERDFTRSEWHSLRVIELARQLDGELDVLVAEVNHAALLLDADRIDEAVALLEDVLDGFRRAGYAEGIGLSLLNLGEAAYRKRRDDEAEAHFGGAREAFAEIGFRSHVGHALQGMAGVEARRGRHLEAARLLGEADALLNSVGASADDFSPAIVADATAASRDGLGEAAFAEAFETGVRAARPA